LYAYHWPGNVRELQNVLQRYLATRDIDAVLAFLGITSGMRAISEIITDSPDLILSEAVKALEKRMISEALAQMHYRIGKTAEKLGMPRRTLQYKIKKYALMPKN
jgi:arginine utilization regulatory protein